MNVVKMVREIMVKAVHNFAKKEGVEPKEVQFFIHTKGESNLDGGDDIRYFYGINGRPVRNEEGEIKALTFLDILNKKIDLMNFGSISMMYLRGVFKENSKEYGCDKEDLFIMIVPNSKADDVVCCLYEKSKALKKMTLQDLFGSEDDKRD